MLMATRSEHGGYHAAGSSGKKPVGWTVFGTGRMGSSLALRLYNKGFYVRSLFNRSMEPCREIAGLTKADCFQTFPRQLSDLGDVVFICLPDDQIEGFSKKMAGWLQLQTATGTLSRNPVTLTGNIRESGEPVLSTVPNTARNTDRRISWVHTSGSLPAGILLPLSPDGSGIAAMHPVQTFTSHNRDTAFDDCFVTLQGDPELCSRLEGMVRKIGARPLLMDEKSKMAVHLAAVIACNYLAPLFAASDDILQQNDVEVKARELFGPLVKQAVENLLTHPPEEVLTGPVVRGDPGTIERHLTMLGRTPQWKALYCELGQAVLGISRNVKNRDNSQDSILLELLTHGRS